MNRLRFARVRPLARWGLVACGALGSALGCESILGIHDVSLEASTGGATASSSTSSAAGGSTSSSSASVTASSSSGSGGASSSSGTGGQPATGTFGFAITDATVNVPYGGTNFVNVSITPTGGFDAAVDVAVLGPPTGLVTMPAMIAAGSTTGKLPVGASGALSLGTTFTLDLQATSGSIVKTASVQAVVTGKPGDLDMSFGSAGVTSNNLGNTYPELNDIREVGQSKILVGGVNVGKLGGGTGVGFRFLADGNPDTSFATTGMVTESFCGCTKLQGGIVSVAREVDGTVLFVGWGNGGSGKTDDIYLYRYKDDGTFDVVQSDDGTEQFDLGGQEEITQAALVPNSMNVVAVGTKDGQLLVTRFQDRQAFGFVDVTFAAPKGYLIPNLGGSASGAGALAFDAMGRILVAGSVQKSDRDLVLIRTSADGTLDASFGTGGIVTVPLPGNQHGSAVIPQADGTILVAGDDDASGGNFLVARFTSAGALDTTYGTMGIARAPMAEQVNMLGENRVRMAQMLDGRVVLGGNLSAGSMSGPIFARLATDATLDPTFGTNGELTEYFGAGDTLGAMSLASDGKILLAGSTGATGGVYIARIWN